MRAPQPALRLVQLLRLAVFDLRHERWLAFCAACVLAATLAPLWTLWGLERGVVGTLIDRQNQDPVMRQILPESSGGRRFDEAWFARVRAWPDVAFVMPNTRAIANQVTLFSDAAAMPQLVDFLPTATRDPLLGELAPPQDSRVLLSATAAQRLSVRPGGKVRVALERQRDGVTERAAVDLEVADVLPVAQLDGSAALASLSLLEAVQAWRDGYTIIAFGPDGNGPPPATDVYPLFRLYAASIQGVGPLVERLEAEGISTHARTREIEATLGLQRNLRAVLTLMGVITAAGAVIALTALQMATVRRKRREYALFKLTGHGRAWLMAMPCVHAVAVALLGGLLALVAHAAAAWAINLHFADHLATGEAAVRLRAVDVASGLVAAVLVSVLPALWGGWRASLVEAADELRDP